MKRAIRMLGLMTTTLGILLAMAVMGGNTTPMCGADSPAETACLTAADCTGEGAASCEGAWACVDATCQWQCTVEPAGCYSDLDCAKGTHCSVSDGECLNSPECPACDVCWGTCVDDVTPPAACMSDSECGAGEFCDTSVCLPPPGCTGDMACPAVCYGQCAPKIAGCATDTDCAADQFCDFSGCPVYAGADRMPCQPDASGNCLVAPPACEGTCVTRPVVTGCTSDAECAPGQICELQQQCYAVDCGPDTDCGGGATPPCETVGVCVPAPQPDCFADSDCPEGFYCALYKCDPTTNCDAAGNCGDKCLGGGGQCLPIAPPSPCDTVKCAAGTHCEVVSACEAPCVNADGSACDPATGVAPCAEYAQCVPDSTGCVGDAECPLGYVCQLYPCDCGTDPAGVGYDCVCEPWGQCVPAPTGCTTDAECAAGYHCELTSWCACPADVDCSTDPNTWCEGSGTCVPDTQPLCLTNADCAAGEVCNAVEICILLECPEVECSYCHGYCVPQQVACYSDVDCPAGQVCQLSYGFDASGAMTCCPSNTDQVCLMIYPVCEGVCVPAAIEICGNGLDDDLDGLVDENCPVTGSCTSDADCLWYETCSLPYFAGGSGGAAPMACCQPGMMCIPEMPPCQTEGVCVLMAGYCWSDADCAWGETCQGATYCPPGAYCLVAAGPGKCAPGVPQPEICGNGLDDDLDGLVDEDCGNVCPDGTTCAAGEVCEEQAVCPPCTYADPPCMMPCALAYVCVPAQPNPCVVSGCSGQICAPEPMASTCEWLPWYACFGLATCELQPYGQCDWTPNPEFKQCMLDNGGF